MRYGAAKLIGADIQRVKLACASKIKKKYNKSEEKLQQPEYFVEFPEEENEVESSANHHLNPNEEDMLGLSMGSGMSLKKRKQSGQSSNHDEGDMDTQISKTRKIQKDNNQGNKVVTWRDNFHFGQFTMGYWKSKAEEESHIKPPAPK